MLIQGFFTQSSFIQLMLEHEDAFSLMYEDGKEIRCAHYKGDWTMVLIEGKKVKKAIAVNDSLNVNRFNNFEPDPLIQGFVSAKQEILQGRYEGREYRELPAAIINELFLLLAGHENRVKTINVVQSGRNGTVDCITGEFHLQPRND